MQLAVRLCLSVWAAVAIALWTAPAVAVERFVIRKDGHEISLEGETVVEAQDQSRLFHTASGDLWNFNASEVVRSEKDDRPFKPMTPEEAGKYVLGNLPAGFEVYRTKNYVICHNGTKAYAQWVGALFERLHRAFHTFWTTRGVKLVEPKFPLVAVVFADAQGYKAYADKQYGKGAGSLVAFYSLRTNQVTLYDLTGVGALRREGAKRGNAAQINEMLSHKDAALNVSCIVHEAFHQLQFNCGLSQRYADIPLWVAEGLAVYFETPDLESSQGWRTVGAVNYGRLATLGDYLPNRPAQSLKSMMVDDKRFSDPRQAVSAYAEAWAMNHFLMQRYGKKYVKYLQTLAAKQPGVADAPEARLREFESTVGSLTKLDAEFLKHVKALK
jgi:hypothetical protein